MQIRPITTLCAALLLAFAIVCASANAAAESLAANLYVVQNDPSTGVGRVLQLPTGEQGGAWQGGPKTLLSTPTETSLGAVTTDAAGNLYVSSLGTSDSASYAVTEYVVSSKDTVTRTRTLTNMPSVASAIAVDASGQVYTVNGSSISVYAASATGSAAPVRTITGASTLLNAPTAIAVDGVGNLYVANAEAGNVLVFSAAANGDVAPNRTIAGVTTGITQPWGVAVDAAGDLFVTTSASFAPAMTARILEFAPGAAGDVAPIRTINVTSPNVASGIAVDAAGNLYASLTNASTLQLSVGVYATDSASLAQTITASAWTATKDAQIAVR